jgi:hypothetical protein
MDFVCRGAPAQDLSSQLAHLLWPHQNVPTTMLVTDTSHYFWHLPCKKHLRILTVQGAKRQVQDGAGTIGQLSACERCAIPYRSVGPETQPDDVHRSYYEQVAWLQLEYVLESVCILQPMSAINTLHGKDLGYVVEVKVLKGKFGKADVYVPSIDLIIQVDGEHHNMPAQLSVDARFNAECVKQNRRVLRLYYKDVCTFRNDIQDAVHSCITSPSSAWAACSSQHPAKIYNIALLVSHK